MQLIKVKTNELIANDYNPNIVKPAEYKRIVYSIKKFGQVVPILVCDKKNGEDKYVIVDGEHRWKILDELGINDCWVVISDSKKDLEEYKMLTIALNDTGGDINHDLLKSMFDLNNESIKEFFKEMNFGYLIDQAKKDIDSIFKKMEVDWECEDIYEEKILHEIITIKCTEGELEQFRIVHNILKNTEKGPLELFNDVLRVDKMNEDDIFYMASCLVLRKLFMTPISTLEKKGKKQPYSLVFRCKTFASAQKLAQYYIKSIYEENKVVERK